MAVLDLNLFFSVLNEVKIRVTSVLAKLQRVRKGRFGSVGSLHSFLKSTLMHILKK